MYIITLYTTLGLVVTFLRVPRKYLFKYQNHIFFLTFSMQKIPKKLHYKLPHINNHINKRKRKLIETKFVKIVATDRPNS